MMPLSKSPKAVLLSATPAPLQVMWNAWYWSRDRSKIMTFQQGATIPSATYTKIVQHALNMLKEHVPIPEMVNLVWGLDHIPRSFQEQIVRTRKAAFFCETMRVADKSKFQENDDYFHLPPLPAYLELTDITNCYQIAMAHAEYAYKKLQDLGVPREIARGVLPLHINSCLVMGISLREFTRLMGQRTCWIAQGDYWRPLIEDFRKELLTYLGAEICDYVFNPPC